MFKSKVCLHDSVHITCLIYIRSGYSSIPCTLSFFQRDNTLIKLSQEFLQFVWFVFENFAFFATLPTLENKSISISERGLTSTRRTEYSGGTERVQYSTVPTSSITAETVTVDGVVLSQKDTAGIVTTATRSYPANGVLLTQTDG